MKPYKSIFFILFMFPLSSFGQVDTTIGCGLLANNLSLDSSLHICAGDTVTFRCYGNDGRYTNYENFFTQWFTYTPEIEIVSHQGMVAKMVFKSVGIWSQGSWYSELWAWDKQLQQNKLVCSGELSIIAESCPPSASLTVSSDRICVGDNIDVAGLYHHAPDTAIWNFIGQDTVIKIDLNNDNDYFSVQYSTPGLYPIECIVQNTSGSDTVIHTIEVLPRPTRLYDIELDEQYTIRPNDTLRLHTAYQSDYYNWQPSVTNLACLNCANPLFTATTEGFYPFVCTAGVGECSENSYIGVTVKDDIRYFAPTAFTPNGDGLNELFEIKGYDIDIKSIKIFDRWGNLVYYGEGNTAAWDGANHLSGNYVWLMECTDRYNNQSKTRKGSVMLLR